MAAVCVLGDLGPGCLDLTGVTAGDRNLMYVNLKSAGALVVLDGSEIFQASARTKSTDPGAAPIIAEVGIADAATGRLSIRWPGDQVRTWLGGKATKKGVWDLQQVHAPPDFPVTILSGSFTAREDTTRDGEP